MQPRRKEDFSPVSNFHGNPLRVESFVLTIVAFAQEKCIEFQHVILGDFDLSVVEPLHDGFDLVVELHSSGFVSCQVVLS
jgi:hypothetical protein